MITHFAVGMPVETFKSKKKIVLNLDVVLMAKIEHISRSNFSFVVLFRPGCSLCPMVGAGVFIFQKMEFPI